MFFEVNRVLKNGGTFLICNEVMERMPQMKNGQS